MIILFPIGAFLLALAATARGLGFGLVAIFVAGYSSGYIRANYLGLPTTFMFDCGVLGLYVGFLVFHFQRTAGIWSGSAARFLAILILWPMLLTLVPINDFLVQLVALRAAIWYLPIILIASRLTTADLTSLARGLAVLNLIALAGGVYVYLNGIEALYPRSPITELMFRSKDVAGGYYRVPSFFLSAHAYGGTMLGTLPLLLGRGFDRGVRLWERGLMAVGTVASLAGILMCSARQPALIFVIATLITWACMRFNPIVGAVAAVLVTAAAIAALSNDRLQRAIATFEDPDQIIERVYGSANESSLQLFWHYPAGAGLGSASSIPYFLVDRAPPQISSENEYSRIQVEEGWVGLFAWLGFLGWLFYRPPRPLLDRPWQLGAIFMFAFALTSWATAIIGTGLTAAIPGTVLLFTQMGVLVQVRERGTVRAEQLRRVRPARLPAPKPARRPLVGGRQ
jgi:hypothetical protein